MNLERPKQEPNSLTPTSPTAPVAATKVDPARVDAISRRAKEILDSGRIPEWLFLCGLPNGVLTLMPGPDQRSVVLLFSSPFAAKDYLRATKAAAEVRQFKVAALPQLAQLWLASGAGAAAIDRCPRCPQFVSCRLEELAKSTPAEFAKVWALHRATRFVVGGSRVRSALAHMASGNNAAARTDLEYVRDHFDCGVPYLHQAIAAISGLLQDEPSKAAALERLREFGPQFAGPSEPPPKLWATMLAGLSANFDLTGRE